MIPLIISLTAAALSLAAAAVAAVRVRRLAARLKSQKAFADALNRLCASSDPTEHRFITMPFRGSILVLKSRGGLLCLVKKFTSPDEDFNRLCAEELVEKLNEK